MLSNRKNKVSDRKAHDPFGMLLVGRNWEEGSEYRFGFNTQEQDDEVYGNGNLNSAIFWEYDTRLGRRWNLDPVVNQNMSGYACMGSNPIKFSDVFGDKINLDKLYEKDAKSGEYLHPNSIKAFELFASTKKGKHYILEHAQEGFKLEGVYLKDLKIEAKKEGKKSEAGVDLVFTGNSGSSPAGESFTSADYIGGEPIIKDGVNYGSNLENGARLQLTFNLYDDLKSKLWQTSENEMILYRLDVLMHEVLLHGQLIEGRYFNNYLYKYRYGADDYKGDHDFSIVKTSEFYYESSWATFDEAQTILIGSTEKDVISYKNFIFLMYLSTDNKAIYPDKIEGETPADTKKRNDE